MTSRVGLALLVLAAVLLVSSSLLAADPMPTDLAGDLGQPSGQIAFLRDGDVWIMDAYGGNQMMISEVNNADGRLSWAPDGKRVAFTRSGKVDVKGPDYSGGYHKLYDIFIAYVDSAKNGNSSFWYRVTSDVGSRDPEWSADGQTITFYKDMYANEVSAFEPSYQVCTISPDGDDFEVVRPDWRNLGEYFVEPSVGPNGKYAICHMYESEYQKGKRRQGMAILTAEELKGPLAAIREKSAKLPRAAAPAWSPDGKWVAYIHNSATEPAVMITTPDMLKQYQVFVPPPGTSLRPIAPSFSPNSKWLTFGTTDGSVWTCDITGGNARRLTGPGSDAAPAWSKTGIKHDN